MDEHHAQQDIRFDKLKRLRERGIDAYPYRFAFTHTAQQVHDQADRLMAGGDEIALAGRLMAVRRQGKAAFAHIKDNHVRLQIYLRQDEAGLEAFERFGLTDLGDYVGLHGTVMRTKTGELTLRVKGWELLAKALRPLPVPKVEEKDGVQVVHDAVADVEFRYRQRYADLALNDGVAKVFRTRAALLNTVRAYLVEQGFLEVETPVLQPLYGGAAAQPFTTRHRALDLTLYLRVATELYLKRLVAGGIDRVFEIGKNFRNEGIDRTHNPEFTMLEFYQAYADYRDMMDHVEAIWERCAMALHGSTRFTYEGTEIDVKRPWPRIVMQDAVKTLGGVDVAPMSDAELQGDLQRRGLQIAAGFSRGLAVAALFERLVEPKLIQPTFITDFPRETTPLCKAHRSAPGLVERFEPYIMGFEIGNAYSELNDPIEQRRLFEEQVARRKGGDLDAQPYDADFLRAMEYGMPPMGGVGIGLDRMVMLLTGQHSIRDVLLFPTMRPEQAE
ncbi:MAG: lysine--tRNA ligase [SAR324 cluster bacterium]